MLFVKTVLNFECHMIKRKKILKMAFPIKNNNLISLQLSQFPTVLLAKTFKNGLIYIEIKALINCNPKG